MAAGGVFITGTDTGVGKTVVSACLVKAWGWDYWKPVQTGLDADEGDTATVARLAGLGPERLHAPAYRFGLPLSPHLAALQTGQDIALDRIVAPNSAHPLVVEGAGGALVPLNDSELMIDLMVRLGLPVLVAAADRLGAINHTLLTLEALYAHRLEVLGVMLTGGSFGDNAAAIERYGRTRVLGRLPWVDRLDEGAVETLARTIPPFPYGSSPARG